ncbi:MAG: hypothetical protein HZC43_05870 [Nitrosomonadales bacterium]|nr:hypothetical protein [Nitrosomonadales bacterium]
MEIYDPQTPPDPAEWLALDEQERIILALDYHLAARIKLPEPDIHATIHAVVENQIAEGVGYVVRGMARLKDGGLSRHDALHAIGCVLAEHIFDVLKLEDHDLGKAKLAHYETAVEKLTAKSWRKRYGA